MKRMKLSFEIPENEDPMMVLSVISQEEHDDMGHVELGGEFLSWHLTSEGEGIDLDRRQRLAAAMLIMAFDLPQPMTEAAKTMMEAAALCPGLTTGEIGTMGKSQRLSHLNRARDLIDEMIAEIREAD